MALEYRALLIGGASLLLAYFAWSRVTSSPTMSLRGRYSVCWVTAPTAAVAETIARTLVEGRLAACVNIVPNMTSVYSWKGKVEVEPEIMLMIKTRTALVPRVVQAVKGMHPYEVPEVISAELEEGLPAYLNWIGESTQEE